MRGVREHRNHKEVEMRQEPGTRESYCENFVTDIRLPREWAEIGGLRLERWSRNFRPTAKVDRMTKVTIQNEETQEPFA